MFSKIISVFGTRPEAIKMAPVILELEKTPGITQKVIVTGQHRELLDQVVKLFGIRVDYDLNVMRDQQQLTDVAVKILGEIGEIYKKEEPDLILVHGDTITAFISALAALYNKIPVGHVEAGLRTYEKYDPFPEEMNRQLIDVLADIYFAPTNQTRDNLIREGKNGNACFVTGNTVIDALLHVTKNDFAFVNPVLDQVDFNHRVILLTTHRRENIGDVMRGIHSAVAKIVTKHKDVEVVFPVHPNPKVKEVANEILGGKERIHLVDPLDYQDMAMVMKKCYMVMTDSGGLQEEAPALNKPVLVLRETTERQEGVDAGTLKLVGTNEQDIFDSATELLENKTVYSKMANSHNPYGDGKSANRIVTIITNLSTGYMVNPN